MSVAEARALRIDELPEIGPAAITLGVFDGVHRGHQALLGATAELARDRGWSSVALVFDPHPDEVLRPGTRVPRLAPLGTILGRITRDVRVDHALPLRFDDALRSLTAEEFLAALAPEIALRAIVLSPESAFGRGRGGTVARLREIGAVDGFEVVTVDPVLIDGAAISSMRIRDALDRGDLVAAAAFGYAPGFVGSLSDGRLVFDYLPALPVAGRYRAIVRSREAAQRVGEAEVTVEESGIVRVDLSDPDPSIRGAVTVELVGVA